MQIVAQKVGVIVAHRHRGGRLNRLGHSNRKVGEIKVRILTTAFGLVDHNLDNELFTRMSLFFKPLLKDLLYGTSV